MAHLHLVVDGGGGTLARRAAAFRTAPTVWVVEGRALTEAGPAPFRIHSPLPPEVLAYTPMLEAAGCDVTVEHGRLIGEVLGLEVARVQSEAGVIRMEVGVGRFDREAHAVIDDDDGVGGGALAAVVDLVREHRRPGAPRHPLNQLVPERLLRRLIVDEPGLVGGEHLRPVPALSPLPDLRSSGPVPAVGVDPDGRAVVVVCSVGVDVDLVPAAADMRLADGRDARLVLAVPGRDAVASTRELAAALTDPAEVVAVDLPSRS
ncbi:MAG: hypothetical protein M3R01_12990 [Actinomycetota bacterium]|nr:hypothetical protein [Actinomycetota bacterium]